RAMNMAPFIFWNLAFYTIIRTQLSLNNIRVRRQKKGYKIYLVNFQIVVYIHDIDTPQSGEQLKEIFIFHFKF
ncbi:hypothetical protein ABNF14_18545, partial [Paenibacillus larvae]